MGALQDSLALAHNAIVARLDPSEGYRPFFRITLDPLCSHHDSWDYVDMAGRYVESMAMIRQLTGHEAPKEEEALKRFLLNMQQEDGLFYNREPFLADMFCQSRALLALSTWYMDTGEPTVLAALRKQVLGLMRIALPFGSGLRYPCNLYRQGEWIEGGLFYEAKDLFSVKPGYGGTQLEGIVKYVELSGDEEPLEFVRAYLRYFLDEAQVVREDGSYEGHLHSQGIVPTMVAAAMLGKLVGDKDLLGLCERFLTFTLSHCSSFGWVPDGIGWPTCETCALGDVIHLMTILGGHWETVERFAKNQLLENQFRNEALGVGSEEGCSVLGVRCSDPNAQRPTPNAQRMIPGSFASWAKPNDLLGGPDLEGCCLGGGVRGIFHVLNNAVTHDEIRMFFGMETEDWTLSTTEWIGNAESVRFRAERSLKAPATRPSAAYRIRHPENTYTLTIDGVPTLPTIDGQWIIIEPFEALEIVIDQQGRTEKETVAGIEYEVDWLGDVVTALRPLGDRYPTYTTPRPPSTASYPKQTNRIQW